AHHPSRLRAALGALAARGRRRLARRGGDRLPSRIAPLYQCKLLTGSTAPSPPSAARHRRRPRRRHRPVATSVSEWRIVPSLTLVATEQKRRALRRLRSNRSKRSRPTSGTASAIL